MANLLPMLLWTEWALAIQCAALNATHPQDESENNPLEDDLAALRIALLAAYQQDYHISPLPALTRTIPFSSPSIYRNYDPEIFPFNVEASQHQQPPPQTEPLDRFDDHSRATITFRLCRFFQDYSPQVSHHSLLLYAVLIARLSTVGTRLDSTELKTMLTSGSLLSDARKISQRDRSSAERRSDLALGFGALSLSLSPVPGIMLETTDQRNIQVLSLIKTVFYPDSIRRRYPMRGNLALLWADVLPIIGSHCPGLEDYVRHVLISRARINSFPAAILALDSSNGYDLVTFHPSINNAGKCKPRGLHAARKLKNDRRASRWADKTYRKRALGTVWKASPFQGASHATGIVLEKLGIESKQPNSAVRKAVRVQLIKGSQKKVTAFVPNDGCLNFVEINDKVLLAGFGNKGRSKGDVPGVKFKVVKVSGVALLALWKGKKEKPRS